MLHPSLNICICIRLSLNNNSFLYIVLTDCVKYPFIKRPLWDLSVFVKDNVGVVSLYGSVEREC